MGRVTQVKSTPTPLQLLQQAFCLVKLGGDIFIIESSCTLQNKLGAKAPELQFYKLGPARLLMMRYLEAQPVSSDPRKVIEDFLVSPKTQVFDRIAFNPLLTPPTTLNLWRGSPVTPVRGDWSVVKGFLLEVICDGDIGLFRYLILFLAHMIQKPEDKPGVLIALLGGQGIGKGGFFRLLEAIWSDSTLLVSDIDHVLGQFNAQIEQAYVLFMDEAIFVGDKRASDRLKSFSTEPTVTIEEKYQPRHTIESFHRIFAASNHSHFAQVDADDRRFLFLRVSEVRKDDFAYWEQYHAAIADPAVIAAIVHDLQTYDVTAFNPRERPKTLAHTDQKIRSLKGFYRYWCEVLSSGVTDSENVFLQDLEWEDAIFVSTESLMRGWQNYDKRGKQQFTAPQQRDMHEALGKLCPAAKRIRKTLEGLQQRGYILPSLPLARAQFAEFLGGNTEWSD